MKTPDNLSKETIGLLLQMIHDYTPGKYKKKIFPFIFLFTNRISNQTTRSIQTVL